MESPQIDKTWAAHDAAAGRAVKRVHAKQKQFTLGTFERMGFVGLEAEIRMRLVFCYLSWEPSMYAKESSGASPQAG